MKFPILTALLLLCRILPCLSQETLVEADELTFRSDFEKRILTSYLTEKKADGFDLFMAGGSLLTDARVSEARGRLYTHLQSYKQEKIAGRKNDKKTRFIYDDVHKIFLKKYQDTNSFEEIFYNGNYNCVSATALYALVFEETGIPFIIKEEPSHVYLIVFPEQEKIKIETTTPLGGIVAMNPAFKQQFVKTLKDQKFISAQEFNNQSHDDLFEKYYFGDHPSITVANLAGIQYMNEAINKNEERKFTEAHALMEKAYMLFPSQRTAYLLMVTGTGALEARKEKDSVHATLVGKLSRFRDYGVTNDMIVGEFARALHQLLFETGKKEEAKMYYRVLTAMIRNEPLLREIEYVFAFESARLAFNQGRYREAAPLFEKALAIKPHHLETANAFISSLTQTFSSGGTNLEHVSALEEYASKYPSLQENNIFNNMIAMGYLVQSGFEYDQDKPVAGEKYRSLFEQYLIRFPDLPVNAQLIGYTYSRSAVYYFRKGQTSRAREVIEAGLKLAPGNPELLTRKQMIR